MKTITMTSALVKEAFLSGAAALDAQKEWINELNVFPVPDGDTGTNMTLTIMSAANEVAILNNPDMKTLCKAISNGSLRGARGNSGVILSQLLRGFTNSISDCEELTIAGIAMAFHKAVETAYKAVMKPKEGTILSVAKAMSKKAMELCESEQDPALFLQEIVAAGDTALENTPNQLPVLKQAGVVDSGGQGLMVIVHAAVDAVLGNPVEFKGISQVKAAAGAKNFQEIDTADIKFGYCTEFIINASFTEEDEKNFKAFLNSIGDSIVCVACDDIVKIHVHTNDPGLAISTALKYGELSKMKIDNMREEHNERYRQDARNSSANAVPQPAEPRPRKDYAVIAVSSGSGLNQIFEGIGVDRIISGGQTMNPSTEDFVKAIKEVNADTVFLLPNNKNIIMAARQAAELEEDCRVFVVPTTSVQQGIACMMYYAVDENAENNFENMKSGIETVKVASVTHSIRNTQIDGYDITAGDYMGIGTASMLSCSPDLNECTQKAIRKLADDNTEVITVYYGQDVEKDTVKQLEDSLKLSYPGVELDIECGGQPVYYYYIAIE